jgi:hypothetical protein
MFGVHLQRITIVASFATTTSLNQPVLNQSELFTIPFSWGYLFRRVDSLKTRINCAASAHNVQRGERGFSKLNPKLSQ